MKRALLSLLVLAGCKPLEVPQGRYACDPTGNREVGSAQCPGTSRCGLEGYCHDVGETSVWWKCVDATDCESGWQCGVANDGVSRECHDPNAPQDHRCLGNADCSGSWTCGLDTARLRRCHDPMKPKAWPCEATSDCVGGWQCGVAATGGRECHDPSNPQAWVCLSNDDCLGGWQCGLNDLRTARECHDPSMPRTFACERDADCLAGWSCGLNDARTARECHDPNAPRAFACERPTDCLGGFVCGLNDTRTAGECHDPNAPRSFACRTDADCVATWDCGLASNRLQRECHDPRNPQAFACEGDADCLGGWRCGVDGTCLNPAADALEDVSASLDAGQVLNPFPQPELTDLSVAPLFTSASGADSTTLAFRRGNRFEALVPNAVGGPITYDLGPVASNDTVAVAQGPRCYVVNPNTFAFEKRSLNHVYVGTTDGGMKVFQLLPDGGAIQSRLQWFDRFSGIEDAVSPRIDRFHTSYAESATEVPNILGFSSSVDSYFVLDGPNSSNVRPLDGLPTTGNRLLDVEELFLANDIDCEFVVDTNGLWGRSYDQSIGNSEFFEPIHSATFGNRSCPGAGGFLIKSVRAISRTRALVTASPPDAGALHVSVLDLTPMMTDRPLGYYCGSISGCSANAAIPFNAEVGPCLPCPAGVLADVTAVPASVAGQTPDLEARCALDGGASSFFRLSRRPGAPGQCDVRPILGAGSLFTQPGIASPVDSSAGRVAWSGPGGRIWLGSTTLTATSFTFDRAPFGVVKTGPGLDDYAAVDVNVLGLPSGRLGLRSALQPNLTAVASNDPRWVMSESSVSIVQGPSVTDGRIVALSATALPRPHRLVRVRDARGAMVAVVTANNQLWSVEVDATSPAPVPTLLTQRLTVVAPITSLAMTGAAADAGVLAEGYFVSGTSLQHVVEETPTRWRAQEVSLKPGVVPHSVWSLNGRARVGDGEGEVFSLPSRVRIVDPLPERVEDYAQTCTQQLALTASGLFMVAKAPQAIIGQWVRVPLPPNFAPEGFESGRLFSMGGDVFVFSKAGSAARVTVSVCP